MNNDEAIVLYVSGQRLGKALQQAKYIAELAAKFTTTNIQVVPSPDVALLKLKLTEYEALVKRILNGDWDIKKECWSLLESSKLLREET